MRRTDRQNKCLSQHWCKRGRRQAQTQTDLWLNCSAKPPTGECDLNNVLQRLAEKKKVSAVSEIRRKCFAAFTNERERIYRSDTGAALGNRCSYETNFKRRSGHMDRFSGYEGKARKCTEFTMENNLVEVS